MFFQISFDPNTIVQNGINCVECNPQKVDVIRRFKSTYSTKVILENTFLKVLVWSHLPLVIYCTTLFFFEFKILELKILNLDFSIKIGILLSTNVSANSLWLLRYGVSSESSYKMFLLSFKMSESKTKINSIRFKRHNVTTTKNQPKHLQKVYSNCYGESKLRIFNSKI